MGSYSYMFRRYLRKAEGVIIDMEGSITSDTSQQIHRGRRFSSHISGNNSHGEVHFDYGG